MPNNIIHVFIENHQYLFDLKLYINKFFIVNKSIALKEFLQESDYI